MKTGMNLLLWATLVEDKHTPALEKIKATGFDGVEIPIFGGEDAHYEHLRKLLDRIGLASTVVAVCTPEANPISSDASVRKMAVERMKGIVRQAGILGSDVVCGPLHQPLGIFSGSGPTEDELNRAADVHRQVAEEAQKQGVKIALEFLNRFECYFLNTAEATASYVRRVNHPHVKMMFDSFHANIEEENLPNAFAAAAPEIVHVHISNNDRGVPGRGHINFPELFRTIKSSGYDGWLTIEAFGRALPDLVEPTRVWRDFFKDPYDVVTEGYRYIKDTWAAA
jgi:D-psicose/D-tagatose/L-ribulose 3-epimerase